MRSSSRVSTDLGSRITESFLLASEKIRKLSIIGKVEVLVVDNKGFGGFFNISYLYRKGVGV